MVVRAICLLIVVLGQVALGQNSYVSCDPSAVEDLVMDYGINSEKLGAFGYLAEFTHDEHFFLREVDDTSSHTTAVHFEDRLSKTKRIDVLKVNSGPSNRSQTWSVVSEKDGKRLVSLGPVFMPDVGSLHRDFRLPVAADPGMAAISEPGLVASGDAGYQGYWADLLDIDKLLWCETNGRITRGEWTLGAGEGKCHVQVYFDKNVGGLPVLTRFIRPKDEKKKFERFGRSYCCDLKTKWLGYGDGYVPSKVEAMIEYYTPKGVLSSTMELSTEYIWKSTLIRRENDSTTIDPSVFIHNKVWSEDLVKSFRSRNK